MYTTIIVYNASTECTMYIVECTPYSIHYTNYTVYTIHMHNTHNIYILYIRMINWNLAKFHIGRLT